MRQRSCLNSSTQICTLAGAYPIRGIFKYIISKGYNTDFIISAFKFKLPKITKGQNITTLFGKKFHKFIYDIEKEIQGK